MRRRRRMEQELERDIRDHIALETDENIARGMSPEEARFAALRKFGNVALVMEETRRVWGWTWLDGWRADIRHAFRSMRRAPGTTALALLSLALAIAPSVTVFSIMDRLFLTPVAVKAPGEIVSIGFRDTRPDAAHRYEPVSYPEFQEFQRALKSVSGLAFRCGKGMIVGLDGRRTTAWGELVNSDYFKVLGVPVLRGPGFSNGRSGVVISHSMWTREFGGAPDVIGRTMLILGQTFTIDGVASPGFNGTHGLIPMDIWMPVETCMRLLPGVCSNMSRREDREGQVLGRLRPGVTPAQAAAEVDSICRDMARTRPDTNRHLTGSTYAVFTDRERGGRNMAAIGVLVLGILLAVACANVTGILLARAEERRRDTAIRQALGASRGRLIREWMVESAIIAVLAAAAGVAAARVLMQFAPALLPPTPLPLGLEFSMSTRVWLYAGSLVLVSALSFGLVPAWRASRSDLLAGLRRDAAVSVVRMRIPIRSLLIVAQVAAAEVLLFGAGVVLNSLSAVQRLDPGFNPRRPVAMALMISAAEDGKPRDTDSEALARRLAGISGVRRAAYGKSVPLSGMRGPTLKMEVPGREPREILGGSAGPEFLSMLGVPLLSGRDLERTDEHGVVVNATLARLLDPEGRGVGRQIRLDGGLKEVVGVFQDTAWTSLRERASPRAIVLTPARGGGELTFAIEVDSHPEAYVAALRDELKAVEPGAIVNARTLRQHYEDAMSMERTAIRTSYALGLLAVLMAAAGLHGITSALFARRSKEFAIRMALGAAPRQIVVSVLAGSVRLAVWGLALGLIIAFPGALVMASRVEGVSAWSVPALGVSSAIVIAAALAAAAKPAGRALRIAPAEVVRAE